MLILFEVCENVSLLRTILVIMTILKVICTIAPILLIIMLTIDFGKNVVSGNSDEIKKNLGQSFRRIVACLIIFLIPTVLNYTFDLVGRTGAGYTKCLTNANLDTINDLEEQQLSDNGKKNDDEAYGTGSAGDNKKTSKSKKDTSSDKKTDSKSKEKKDHNYKFEKDLIVLGHYHDNKISKRKIVILNSKGKKAKNENFTFTISKPIAKINKEGKIEAQFAGKATVKATLKEDTSYSITFKLTILKATYTRVETTKTIKTYNLKTKEKVTLAKGTKGIYNGAGMMLPSDSNVKFYYHGDILKVDGKYYSVDYQDVKPYAYYVTNPYSKEVAEEFINGNKFTSKTKYLFWVDQGTEMNYYFKKVKGKWKLKDQFEINTGDVLGINAKYNGGNCNGSVSNSTFSDGLGECNSFSDSKVDVRRLDSTWKGYWVGLKYVVWNHKDNGGGWLGAWHEGYSAPREPKSHGCVRHRSSVMIWIRDNMSRFGGSRIINF